jgi:hypothetical protein
MVASISSKDFYEEMLAISTAIKANPDTYIHTYIHVCVCVTQILVQGEIKDLLLGIMDQNRSILQKWQEVTTPTRLLGLLKRQQRVSSPIVQV